MAREVDFPADVGWVLAIDQASNQAGVSLWYNGKLKATTVLQSTRASDKISTRLKDQVNQLTRFLQTWLPGKTQITRIVFEGVRARLVMITVGAFLTCPRIDAGLHAKYSFVESTQWKYWAHKRGAAAPVKDIKGLKALKEIGYPIDANLVYTDDIADSVLIFLTYRDRV